MQILVNPYGVDEFSKAQGWEWIAGELIDPETAE
jgi:hypothetical protein